ncbi:FMN-binding negative transcriptional regulator [Sphaerisporangium perillae]|uniref:FMN-binding negative transcriptional regulator n=1 Tax=Sphaerisporangium perillae TaxID=2935860 RepID=UPI00200E8056|nr:FMN-binding negative transcriptional regulator [Sphaerisporangium perillae]
MYIPQHFAAPGPAAVAELLDRSGASDLVTMTPRGMVATLVPFVFDPSAGEHGALLGHLARNNEQWRHASDDAEALVIVRGPDAYVTPSWYATKREHGRVVPTWNYVTAHVYGRLVAHDDPAWTESLVRRLTEKHESARPAPWTVDDAPEAHIRGQLRAIVGIEVVITRVEAKWKLSQNRSPEDIEGVVTGLLTGTETDRTTAEAMRGTSRRR